MTPDPALDTSAAVQLDGEPRLLALVRELAHHAQPELAARLPVALGSRLERDLGLDSLARVELGLRVEREFDVRLPENLAAEAETPADLLRALRAAQPGKHSEPVSFVPRARPETRRASSSRMRTCSPTFGPWVARPAWGPTTCSSRGCRSTMTWVSSAPGWEACISRCISCSCRRSHSFRASRWLHAIHAWRGTVSAAPNFAFELLASRVDARDLAGLDLSSWRWAFNGAEGVSADTLVRFAECFRLMGFDPRSIAPVYGLAECALDLAFPPSRRGALVDHVDRERLMATGRAVAVAPAIRVARRSSPAGGRSRVVPFASPIARDGRSRTASRGASSSRDPRRPRATIATPRRPRHSRTASGSTPATSPTLPPASSS